jgi:hypothetical protein
MSRSIHNLYSPAPRIDSTAIVQKVEGITVAPVGPPGMELRIYPVPRGAVVAKFAAFADRDEQRREQRRT